MSSLSKYISYVFFAFALVCGFINYRKSGDTAPLGSAAIYNPKTVSSYSSEQVRNILKSTTPLSASDLHSLMERYPTPVEQPSQPSDNAYCKETVNILKSERDSRIHTEQMTKLKSRLTLFLTVFVGVFILFLKNKLFPKVLVSCDEKRIAAINIIEFVFGMLIVGMSCLI